MSNTAIASLFENLESRIALDGSPLPTLAMLEDPGNTVVRFETTRGDVDVELFDTAAPATIATLLNLVRAGDYADTLFHSLIANERLRTGLYRFDGTDLSERGVTFPVDDAPTRANLVQTVSMPVDRSGPSPVTTGDIVFNLGDNSAGDNEYAVFGRVIQGWSVILDIAGLPTLDLSGFFPGSPIGPQLTQTPVTSNDPPPTAVTPDLLISLTDVQVIKPGGVEAFYTERLYFPEGYSWERTFEAIELLNPGGEASAYQIIVRYETGERDQVVATDLLDAQRRESVVIAPGFGQPSAIVRNNEPYAYEVWSTTPIVAGFSHKDFKAGVGETFFRPASLPDPAPMLEWTFNQAALGFNPSHAFLVWQNTTGQEASITVRFYSDNAEPLEHSFTLGAHRRGGVNLLELLPAGSTYLGARISADHPIVAAITRYDTRSGGNSGDEGAMSALGTPGGGATDGVSPGAARGPQDPMTVLNTSDQDANITFYVTEEGSTTPVERTVVVPARRLVVLSGAGNPASAAQNGQFFSIRYDSDVPVTVGFVTSAFRGTGTASAIYAAETTYFADARAFTAPRGAPFGQQSVSLYNPGDQAASITLTFTFDDHDPVTIPAFTLPAGQSTHRRITEFTSILAQALGGNMPRSPYSLTVASDVPIVAQTSQLNSDGRTELGMTLEQWLPLASILP